MRTLGIALALLSSGAIAAPPEPGADADLFKSIAAVRSHVRSHGGQTWPGYDKAPFGLLLTLDGKEMLLCHASPADGFSPLPAEAITGCDAQQRGNVFPKNFLAAMPVVDGVSTIVMGTPASTGLTTADWMRTVFHEHFHQYQSTFDAYYARLAGLGLSGGDTTGMWMLNYPFPYQDEAFTSALATAAATLHAAVTSGPDQVKVQAARYLADRAALERTVSAKDWTYLEMQLWAEGVARWTELELARSSPDPAVVASGQALAGRTLASLARLNPAASGRELAYPLGAAEAMLLNRCMADWRDAYPQTLALGALVKRMNPKACR